MSGASSNTTAAGASVAADATSPGAVTSPGTLVLVPNALDLGTEAQPLDEVLSAGALRRAAGLAHWVVEDARSARGFLKRVDALVPLARPLQSIGITELPRPPKGRAAPVPATAWSELLAPARAGHDLGLLSEAGLPAVADPGAALVAAAHAAGLRVWPLAGASAILLALAASGMDGQSFAFVGYLPQEGSARAARLRELEALSMRQRQTQVFIETPYRNAALLHSALETLAPQTRLAVACGLTLPQGFVRSATVGQWRSAAVVLPDRLPAVFVLQG
jgi:16S rRNA (cytidine1402-2'-O)-methyltransferase